MARFEMKVDLPSPGSGFKLADAGLRAGCHEDADVLRQVHSFGFGLLVENGHLRFEVGRLDVDLQAPFEAGPQTFH